LLVKIFESGTVLYNLLKGYMLWDAGRYFRGETIYFRGKLFALGRNVFALRCELFFWEGIPHLEGLGAADKDAAASRDAAALLFLR
jgi:hypothetical protein